MTTEDGQEPIEEIEVGDKVLSENELTGEVAVKTVTETYINETDELIHICVNGETISATPTHPFYVDKLGWTLARLCTKKAKPVMNRLCFLHIKYIILPSNVGWWYLCGSGGV